MGDLGWQRNTDEAARVAAEVNGTGGTKSERGCQEILLTFVLLVKEIEGEG